MKKIKKGIVKKNTETILIMAGSRITTTNEDGEVKTYILGSDIGAELLNNARLFPTR
jgi:hypothetical protein